MLKFHATAVRRREARATKTKETKRRWLVELYSVEQEQHARSDRDAIRRDAQALFNTLSDAEVDEETARLMEWTDHLDYESYYATWQAIATTAPTDAHAFASSTL